MIVFRQQPLYLPEGHHELYCMWRLHCAMETMLIRTLSEHVINKKSTEKSTSFLKCSGAAKNAAYAMIVLFIDTFHKKERLNSEELLAFEHKLLILKHQLFIELLKGAQRTALKVGEISEQALLALSLLPSGEWKKAVYVRSYVCGGLWSFRSTFANWARLQGSKYLSPDKLNQDIRKKSLGEDTPYHSLANADPVDMAPEAPEAFEEDEENNEKDLDNEEDLDNDLILSFSSIQLQSQDVDMLLQRISSALDLCHAELDDGSSLSVTIEK